MIQAAVMAAPREPIQVEAYPEPVLEPGAIFLETTYSEVCGTDVHLHQGHLAGVPYPIIPGHVSVGRIVSLGGKVEDVEGRAPREGDMATFLNVHETCGKCWFCLIAKASTHAVRTGESMASPIRQGKGYWGGWSERCVWP